MPETTKGSHIWIPGPWPDSFRCSFGGVDLDISPRALRNVSYNGVNLIEAIYPALRSSDWSTLELIQTNQSEIRTDSSWDYYRREDLPGVLTSEFEVSVSSSQKLVLRNTVTGHAATSLNRWGINICLSTKAWAGSQLKLNSEEFRLPMTIAPQQVNSGVIQGMFPPSNSLFLSRADGLQLSIVSTGLILESEDQRNWTDSSYKIYGGSLQDPRPLLLQAGDRWVQEIAIEFVPSSAKLQAGNPHIKIYENIPLPEIGIQLNDEVETRRDQVPDFLNVLGINHVRIDLENYRSEYMEILKKAGLNLELASLSESTDLAQSTSNELSLAGLPKGTRVLSHLDRRRITKAGDVDHNFNHPNFQIVPGTDAYFVDLHREPGDLEEMASFSIVPTVHLTDSESVFRSLPIQSEAVLMARQQIAKRIFVSPITYRLRGNPEGGHLATQRLTKTAQHLDSRIHTLEAGAWTLGSIHALAVAGASSGTWHELLGDRGIVHFTGNTPRYSPTFHAFSALQAGKSKIINVFMEPGDDWVGLERSDKSRFIVASMRPWKIEITHPDFMNYSYRQRLTGGDLSRSEEIKDWWHHADKVEIRDEIICLEPFEITLLANY